MGFVAESSESLNMMRVVHNVLKNAEIMKRRLGDLENVDSYIDLFAATCLEVFYGHEHRDEFLEKVMPMLNVLEPGIIVRLLNRYPFEGDVHKAIASLMLILSSEPALKQRNVLVISSSQRAIFGLSVGVAEMVMSNRIERTRVRIPKDNCVVIDVDEDACKKTTLEVRLSSDLRGTMLPDIVVVVGAMDDQQWAEWLLPLVSCTNTPVLVYFKDRDGETEVERALFSQYDAKTIQMPE